MSWERTGEWPGPGEGVCLNYHTSPLHASGMHDQPNSWHSPPRPPEVWLRARTISMGPLERRPCNQLSVVEPIVLVMAKVWMLIKHMYA